MTARSAASSLTSLFAPSSIAVLGASSRQGRPGYQVLQALRLIDPGKSIYPITPRYEEILGLQCFADIKDSPPAELAIIASANDRIEVEVSAAIACGAKSLLVFGAPTSNPDRPVWLRRIGDMALEAGVNLLGPDTLGYINYSQKCGATWAVPEQTEPGGIAIVSQSGTIYWEAITNDPRLRFSFAGHSGLESTLTMADLIRYCLTIDSTRVIGIYVETVRDAEGFESALLEAAELEVPIVALYAGRTDQSRAQMMTHAGRLAGGRSDLEGILNRYGAARVESPDEWWTTLALLGNERRIGSGGLAAVMDSGGGIAMYLDFAEELGVPLAELSPATKNEISVLLGFDGEIGSALDFWIGDSDRHARTEKLITTLAADEDTAAVMAFTTYGEAKSAGYATSVADACLQASTQTKKPILAATYTSRQVQPDLMLQLAAAGIPILDGMKTALIAFRHAFRYRSFQSLRKLLVSKSVAPSNIDMKQVDSWKRQFSGASQLAEADALAFLSDFAVPCVPTIRANTADDAVSAADKLGYPVVLKTDEGLAHKAAHGGVHLSLQDSDAVRRAYLKVMENLGPKVIIAPMAAGHEIAIGMVYGQFGPTMMVSAGGTMIELLKDRCHLLGPITVEEVQRTVDELQVVRIISKSLGLNSTAEMELYELISRISHLAFAFGGVVTELDINPVLVSESGCVAVDALIGLSSI